MKTEISNIKRSAAKAPKLGIGFWLRLSFAAIVAALLVIALAGCKQAAKADDAPAPKISANEIIFPTNAPQLASITVETTQNSSNASITLSGRLVWNDDFTVRIYSPVAGRVTKINAEPGQELSAGDALAEVDSPDFGQALAEARTASANAEAAEKAFSRAKELMQHGAAAEKDVETANAAAVAARAEKERSFARLANYGGNDSTTNSTYVLRSPLAGVLVERNITRGQEIRSDLMLANAPQLVLPLFVVTSPAHLWVQLDVPESQLHNLKRGLPLTVRSAALPDETFMGQVEMVAQSLDDTTHSVTVRGSVDNASLKLRAGMFVTAELPVEAVARLQVPAKAVFLRGSTHCIFVEEHPGDFQRREVKAGENAGDDVVVLSGLQPGERIVTDGALLLEEMFD
ncbi:MAG TPA: efflux RND transporter periplasmic adaptor subunit [Verrucomicrobiae bacterium]|jgi:cobalt-zinc-cadmium efflux system membrane fusion protein|nr:efflux RND transporter periplasmic adaptor subunit [Verrucomicrobiae bacterium]